MPPTDTVDEISLRDLYLILRRGLPLIFAVALLAGLTAFLYVSLRPRTYQADAMVLINPSPIRAQSTGTLGLEQRNDISFETYRSLAFSRSVLEDTLERLGTNDTTLEALERMGSVEQLVGPQRADQAAQLTVTHSVTTTDPELSANVANAWAEVTVETVRRTQMASLTPIRETTRLEAERLGAQLAELEARWEEFRSRDESELITAQLTGVAQRAATAEAELESIGRKLANVNARREQLTHVAATGGQGAGDGAASADPLAAVALLQSRSLITPEAAAELTALLRDRPPGPDTDLVALFAQLELQRSGTEAAGLEAERAAVQAQLESYRDEARDLRERMASLTLERDRLDRELNTIRTTYQEVTALEPILAYVTELAPTNSRILNQASVPTEPLPARRLLTTALAVVIAGMAALLFVFLREAVAPPPAAQEPAPERRPAVS